jgi:hypothetical protein
MVTPVTPRPRPPSIHTIVVGGKRIVVVRLSKGSRR